MNDIFDIKWNEVFISWDILLYPIFIVIFLIIFYILLDLIIKKSSFTFENKKNYIRKNIKEKYEYIIIDKLLKLELKIDKSEKNIFYMELNKLFRDYLWYISSKHFLKMTLKEIKLELLLSKETANKNIITLFEKSYNEEFEEWKNTLNKKKKILNNFIILLKKV